MEDDMAINEPQSIPLFGGHQTWHESFEVQPTMKVHCGFIKYAKKCRFVVASGIFDAYDIPYQPSNISLRSQNIFCFLMVVDEKSYKFIKGNVTIREANAGGQCVCIWRLVLLKHPPYDESRRNGKVPKILTHRLFPEAQYSIWIDGKMELIVDPLLILARLGGVFKFFMFPNCEYNSLFVLHPYIRELSSGIEWVKSLAEFEKDPSLKETRGRSRLVEPLFGKS